jgi:hypothetical protein
MIRDGMIVAAPPLPQNTSRAGAAGGTQKP